jgi:outer membrane protein
MKTKLVLFCIGVFMANNVFAETALDIESAVRLALEKNLSLERSRIDREAAQRKYSRSWNSLLPSLEAGALVSRPTSVISPISAADGRWTPGFSLSASLQISPSVVTTIAWTKEEYASGRINYEAARRDLEFQVRRLYCQILLLKENVELARQNVATAESRYRQINAQYRIGQASNLDELSARLDAQTQRTNTLSAEAAYNNALDDLKYLLMIPAEETLIPGGDLRTFSVVTKDPQARGGESLNISAQRQALAALEARRKSERVSTYAPSLNLSWNASPLYSDTSGGWVDNGGQLSISLSLKPDNFHPWSAAKEQLDSLGDAIAGQKSALVEAAMNHQNTIQKLLRNIARSTETIETLRLNVALAGENHRMYDEAYRKGAADLQSLYAARNSVSLAHNTMLSEQYNLITAILELEKELNLEFGSMGRFE